MCVNYSVTCIKRTYLSLNSKCRPGKSPERSHVSSEPYEPISPPQVPVVHEKQENVLLLSQRAEPTEQRYV